MKWMCSKGELGKKLWANFVEIQTLTVAEVLALFPSCCPPLHVLVSLLPPLTPRAYSVASSPLAHPHSVVIAFSIVKFCSGLFTQRTCVESSDVLHDVSKYYIRRSGLCTTYLKNLLQPFLQSNGGSTTRSESISLRVLWKQSNSFRLPGNVASPLVMIGM
jgi:sulfite reductase alpha subunit-like flavoprotein